MSLNLIYKGLYHFNLKIFKRIHTYTNSVIEILTKVPVHILSSNDFSLLQIYIDGFIFVLLHGWSMSLTRKQCFFKLRPIGSCTRILIFWQKRSKVIDDNFFFVCLINLKASYSTLNLTRVRMYDNLLWELTTFENN